MSRIRRTAPWLGQRDNGKFYVFWYDPWSRKTQRRSLGTSDAELAQLGFEKFRAETSPITPPVKCQTRAWASWAAKMCKRARENAKAKGRVYDIDPEFVLGRMAAQEYRCAVSGIEFDDKESHRNPFAPSIDQIKPGGGYLKDNIRIVLVIVNTAMNGWGEGPLRRLIYQSRLTRHGTLNSDPRYNARNT